MVQTWFVGIKKKNYFLPSNKNNASSNSFSNSSSNASSNIVTVEKIVLE